MKRNYLFACLIAFIVILVPSPFVSAKAISTDDDGNDRDIESVKSNTIASSEGFSDLSPAESGYDEAVDLAERNIITGYSDNTFRPFNQITRQHIAVLLHRSLELDEPQNISKTLAGLSDVTKHHEYAREIASVIDEEVFMGSRGKFNPSRHITRGQMASVLVRAFDLQDTGGSVELIDLNTIDPSHRENVKRLAQNNITVGKLNHKGDLYFDADGYLNRIQFAIFLHRAIELSKKEDGQKDFDSLSVFEKEVVRLTNNERKKGGLSSLKVDKKLSGVAKEKSFDMSENHYFDHESPTYGSPFEMMDLFGIQYRAAAENIARGYMTPERVVNAWMTSEGHRKNILNSNFTHIGVGFIEDGRYWTQHFIRK